MILELSNVSFTWPGATEPLFQHCDIEFAPGSTTAILGPNGVGKTTLIEILLGWRRPTAGKVFLDGIELSRFSADQRGRRLALVPQTEGFSFAYSVLEFIMLGRSAHLPVLSSPGEKDLRIGQEALEKVGIPHLAGRSVQKLSGGEQRLVLIARAIVQEPGILLLDEPVNHLDPANREKVLKALLELKHGGVTLILSSHEPEVIDRLAGQIVLMSRGRGPEFGSAENLLQADKLEAVYGVKVRIVKIDGRRVILWGS